MKVQVLQENLQRGLGIVGRAVAARSTLPITANVLIKTDEGRLKLSATDLDISISTWIGAKIDDEGATTIPARLLTDFVAQLPPATVTIESVGEGPHPPARLTCARTKSTVNTLSATDFPRLSTIGDGPGISINPTELRRAIDRVEFAAATDDSRPVITGVSVKGAEHVLTFAASDGFRLAVADIPLDEKQSVADLDLIVPARALREVGRLIGDSAAPVELRVNEEKTRVEFTLTDVELSAQLIQGTFPNYTQLIPTEFSTATEVPVGDFTRGTRIAAIFARDGSGIVRLQVNPDDPDSEEGELLISARADEVGDNEDTIPVRVKGEAAKIAFNSRYLADVLGALDPDGTVRMETTSPSSQGVFRPVDENGKDDYVHVVMPMFVQW